MNISADALAPLIPLIYFAQRSHVRLPDQRPMLTTTPNAKRPEFCPAFLRDFAWGWVWDFGCFLTLSAAWP
jgi:hypothetical protein